MRDLRSVLLAKEMNRRAQMPFSLAAVIILLLSSVSVALVASNQSGPKGPLDSDTLREMNEVALRASQNVEEIAYSCALASIQSYPLDNESELNAKFQTCLQDRLKEEYPAQIGQFRVEINKTYLALLFLRTSFSQLYPSIQSASELGDWSSCTVPTYFTIFGNFTTTIIGHGEQLNKEMRVDNGIYSPLPLLLNRLDQFSASLENSSDLERMVRYELNALVQDRILRGYGAGSNFGQYGTSRILTDEDVKRALLIALLLEERSVFRSFDPGLVSEMPASLANQVMGGIDSLNGSVDPAKLFLSTYNDGPYDTGLIVSQCLYASVDIIVLRWLEYLGVISTLSQEMEEAAEKMVLQITDLFGSALGRDILNESALEWIKRTMSNAGFSDFFYRYVNCDSPDVLITIPKFDLVLYNDHMEAVTLNLSGTFNLDLPSIDLFASERWKAFASDYISNSYQLAEALRSFLKAVALAAGQSSNLSPLNLNLDPRENGSFMEELGREIKEALKTEWCEAAIEQAKHVIFVQDAMSSAFLTFLHSNWRELYKFEEARRFACDQIAQGLADKFLSPRSDFGTSSIQRSEQSIFLTLYSETSFGGGKVIEDELHESISGSMGYLEAGFGGVSFENSSVFGSISKLVAGAVSSLPGIEEVTSALMTKLVRDMELSASLRGDVQRSSLPSEDGFSLLSYGTEWNEDLRVSTKLKGTDPWSSLQISIWDPMQGDSSENRHFVERGNLTLCPFSSRWEIRITGQLESKLSAPLTKTFDSLDQTIGMERTIPLSLSFTLCGFSGWPLQGVSYSPSTTLTRDLEHAVEDLVQALSQGTRCVAKQLGELTSWLQNMESSFSSFAFIPLQASSALFLLMMEEAQGLLSQGTQELLKTLADFLISKGHAEIRTKLFGLRMTLSINPADVSFGAARDLLRFDVTGSEERSQLSTTFRLLQLADGSVTTLFNISLAGKDWSARATLDPWMKVREHMVEMLGMVKGALFELNLPEVVEYRSLSVALSDIPFIGSLLSRLPSPLPGTSVAVDAGFELRCSSPIDDHVVINELEQNPQGDDENREWVELFNPTSQPVELQGWSIRTSHGEQRVEEVSDVIQPFSHLIVGFEGQMLDNGGAEKFPIEERISLCNDHGGVVDSAPWITDFFNDGRTWQREMDASQEWVFKNHTKGERNGPISFPVDLSSFRNMILEAATLAINEIGLVPSLESLASLIERIIGSLMDFFLDAVERSLVDLSLFVDLSIRDGLGAIGAGMRAGLRISGEVIADGLRWLMESVQALILDPTNPGNKARSQGFFQELKADSYLWMSVYGGIHLPKCLSKGISSADFRFSAIIEGNLEFFSQALIPKDRPWRLNGGVVLSGIPTGLLIPSIAHPGELSDIWLFRASIYSQEV